MFESSERVSIVLVPYSVSGRLTNRYHALRVIVDVFQHHLTEGVNLTSTTDAKAANTIIATFPHMDLTTIILPKPLLFSTQKAALLLQAPQQPSQLPHHLAVARPIPFVLAYHDGEVEYKLISAVFPLANADRVANDAVVVDAKSEETVAKLLGRDEKLRNGCKGEEGRGERGGTRGGCYGAGRDLVEDAVSWEPS